MLQLNKKFLPGESVAFQRLIDRLRDSFDSYGFIPHSTTVFEDLDFMREQSGIDVYQINDPAGRLKNVGLRFDHTVPLIRFVSENVNDLTFPFKRYTTRPVFRPDGESGYCEFHSCDIDVVSSDKLSLIYDAEILALIEHSLRSIGLEFCININNRKVFNSLAKHSKIPDEMIPAFRQALFENDVEFFNKVLDDSQRQFWMGLKNLSGNNHEKLEYVRNILYDHEGLNELAEVFDHAKRLGLSDDYLKIDWTLTRNMNYYDGLTCCVHLDGYPEAGSICHGGRYEISVKEKEFFGVGLTINLTYLFDCMLEKKLIKTDIETVSPVLVSGFGSIEHAMYLSSQLRKSGIKVEMFLDRNMALENQKKYAQKRGFRLFVWTDVATDRALKADDIVMMQDLSLPVKPSSRVCWGFFDGVKTALSINRLDVEGYRRQSHLSLVK